MVGLGLDDHAGGLAVAHGRSRPGRGRPRAPGGRRSRAGRASAPSAARAASSCSRTRASAVPPSETLDSSHERLRRAPRRPPSPRLGRRRSSRQRALAVDRRARTRPATTPWASRNGMPRWTSRSARSVAAMSSSDAAAAMRSRSNVARRRSSRAAAHEAQLERVDRVEEVLLVLLHVLVVGQRQGVHARRAARPGAPTIRGALARSSSAASGFFFCGMIDEPLRPRVGQRDEAELLGRPQHDLGAQAATGGSRRSPPRRGSRGRSRGWRPRRSSSAPRRSKPSSRGDRAAVGVEVHARQRAGAERQRRRSGATTKREALAVAQQHPDVGQQVVGEVDRLGALEVGVAGQRPVEVRARRRRRSAAHSSSIARDAASRAAARVNSATSVATWSLRERAVCSLPPTGPAISVSRRSTAMWMSSSSSRERERRPRSSSAATASSAGEQRVAVLRRR